MQELLKKLENAVARSMPEQITRFQNHCQAHSEARAAKYSVITFIDVLIFTPLVLLYLCVLLCVLRLEAEKERAIDGSDEEEEERSGKRVFGPRKRFRWNEEIRSGLLCVHDY